MIWLTFSLNATALIFSMEDSVFVGMVKEIFQLRDKHAFQVEFFGDEIDHPLVEALTGQVLGEVDHLTIFPSYALCDQ